MALKTVDLGPVSSYAIAVSKGYTGTEQEWYELIHNVTTDAQSAADSAASAARDAAAAAQSLIDIGTAKTAAIGEIQDEGTTQKGIVTAEGTTQVGNVQDAKTLAVAAVQAQQGTSVQAVYDKGTEQVTAVGSEGNTQIGLVTAEGTEQVGLVEAKGQEVLESIPEDYSSLVTQANNTQFALENTKILPYNYIKYLSGGQIDTSTNKWADVGSRTKRFSVMPVKAGDSLVIKANATLDAQVAILKSYDGEQEPGDDPDFSTATGWTAVKTITAGTTFTGTVPSDAVYLYCYLGTISGSTTPASILIGGYDFTQNLYANISEIVGNVGDLKSAVLTNGGTKKIVGFPPWVDRYYMNTSGSTVDLTTPTSAETMMYLVDECVAGSIYVIKGVGGSAARLWAFADASSNILSKADANVSATDLKLIAPAGAKYFIANTVRDSTFSTNYVRKYVDLDAVIADEARNSAEALAAYAVETAGPSDIVTVTDGADGVRMKKVVATIEPVQSGTGDPAPDNVRPISGHDCVTVTRTGKNVLPGLITGKTLDNDTGAETSGTNTITDYIPVLPGQSYVLSSVSSVSGAVRVFEYDAYKNYISNTQLEDFANNKMTITAGANTHFIRLRAGNTVLVSGNNYQIEKGSTATAYEPYQAQTIPVNLSTVTGGTVYGGTLTVNEDGTGTVVVDKAIVDLGTLTWQVPPGTFSPLRYNTLSLQSVIAIPASQAETHIVCCTQYKTILQNVTWNVEDTIAEVASGGVYVMDSTYSSVESFTEAMSGVMMCYELATPQTYTLTASQLTTLLGTNNVWADAGQVTIDYRADTKLYIDKQVAALQALILEQ